MLIKGSIALLAVPPPRCAPRSCLPSRGRLCSQLGRGEGFRDARGWREAGKVCPSCHTPGQGWVSASLIPWPAALRAAGSWGSPAERISCFSNPMPGAAAFQVRENDAFHGSFLCFAIQQDYSGLSGQVCAAGGNEGRTALLWPWLALHGRYGTTNKELTFLGS